MREAKEGRTRMHLRAGVRQRRRRHHHLVRPHDGLGQVHLFVDVDVVGGRAAVAVVRSGARGAFGGDHEEVQVVDQRLARRGHLLGGTTEKKEGGGGVDCDCDCDWDLGRTGARGPPASSPGRARDVPTCAGGSYHVSVTFRALVASVTCAW